MFGALAETEARDLALVAFAYLLGSVSFGLLAARRAGVNLRAVGSGNTGATNAGRALGKAIGRRVLALDLLKGAVATLGPVLLTGASSGTTAAAGIAAVLGHCFPLFHGFAGGKGAATGAGVLLAAVPLAGFAAALTFLLVKRFTRRASAGSLAGVAVGFVATAALTGGAPASLALAGGLAALVVARHRANIGRLLRGEEPAA
ncbi:MAG: glycerol-3-phosphate acyltransferase [Myxococcota bacterium]